MADIEVKKDRTIGRLFDWFEPDVARLFEGLPFHDRMRVEEEVVGDDLVIRAEVPGVDPDKDVEITVDNEVLTVSVQRRKEETSKIDGGFRSEFRYGSFSRSIRLPRGATANDVKATYRDGILEVKVPMPTGESTAQKVEISKN